MTFPKNIRMGGITAPIRKIKGLIKSKGIMGRATSYTDSDKQWHVMLDKGMGKTDMVDTLLHESLHLLSEKNNLDLKEGQVEKLSTSILNGLRGGKLTIAALKDTIARMSPRMGLDDTQTAKLQKGLAYVLTHNPKYRRVIKNWVEKS